LLLHDKGNTPWNPLKPSHRPSPRASKTAAMTLPDIGIFCGGDKTRFPPRSNRVSGTRAATNRGEPSRREAENWGLRWLKTSKSGWGGLVAFPPVFRFVPVAKFASSLPFTRDANMPPKAGGGKPGALPAATGMKTMMSFFQKAPAASPPAEKKLAEAAGGADDAVNAILSPVVTGKADGSPGTASSGAKTADKAAMRENVEGVRRKRLLDSSDEEDEASGSGSGSNSKNINSTDSGVPGARGGSSLAGDAFAAAKAAKAGASVARVGQAVEVLRGGSLGGLAQWQRGSLVRQNISGRWKVAMDDGGNCEVTIPNENVRLIAGSGASPAKSGGSPAKAPSAKSAPACAPTAPTPATAAPAKPGKRSCTGSKKRYIASSDEESVADGDDSDFKMGDADSSEEEEDDDAEMLEEDASGDEGAKTTQRRSQGKKSKAGAADKAAAEEQVRAGSKPVETTPKTKPAPSSTLSSPFIPKPVPSSVKSAFAAKACDQNTVSEAKKAKNDKFEAANKERYRWLLDIMDAKKRRPTDEGYDGRTLYIPQTAYAGFSNFEKQFWDIKKVIPLPRMIDPDHGMLTRTTLTPWQCTDITCIIIGPRNPSRPGAYTL
jgi:hypothetical protein